jgi:4-hydroxybenzoate polyprenyltransferase
VEPPAAHEPPLAVDLDGTLIRTDLLWESFVVVLRRQPLALLRVPFWWAQGRARLKQELGRRATLDPALLPPHEGFLTWLRGEKSRGRKLVLATASDAEFATPVGRHFGLFDEILGSDGRQNLRGANKGRTLAARFGERGFDYAGNSHVDLAVWPFTREAVVVNAAPGLPARAARVAKLGPVFPRPRAELPALLSALKPERWPVNLLVLAPLLLLPPGRSAEKWPALLLVLLAFLGTHSAASLLRALLDLDADRRNPASRTLPFAAGDAPLSRGLALIPCLALGAVSLAGCIDLRLGALLAAVLAVEVVRLYRFRQSLLTDVLALAWLAWARLSAGTEVVGGTLALGCAIFSALALAAVAAAERRPTERAAWLLAHGCGLVAGPVLGWFAGTPAAALMFQRPALLLLLWPALLLWIIRGLKTANPSPAQSAARDPFRWALGLAGAAVLWLAAHG